MKTTQHTPGKWTYEVWHYDTRGDRLVVQIGKDAIAELIPLYRPTIEQSKAETEANAQFIVTACNNYYELLEALEGLVNCSDYKKIRTLEMDKARKLIMSLDRADKIDGIAAIIN